MADYQTTVRLDASLKQSVDALKKVHKLTLNRLVNDALAFYIDHLLDEKTVLLDKSREALRAYIARDPDFEAAIAEGIAAEASAPSDPMEGQVIKRDDMKGKPMTVKPSSIDDIFNA